MAEQAEQKPKTIALDTQSDDVQPLQQEQEFDFDYDPLGQNNQTKLVFSSQDDLTINGKQIQSSVEQIPVVQKKKKERNEPTQPSKILEFTHPNEFFRQMEWDSIKQILQYLKTSCPQPFKQMQFFKVTCCTDLGFSINCKIYNCEACLIFNFDDTRNNKIVLVQFQNFHRHPAVIHEKKNVPKRKQLNRYLYQQMFKDKKFTIPVQQQQYIKISKIFDVTPRYIKQRIKAILSKERKKEVSQGFRFNMSKYQCQFEKVYDYEKNCTKLVMMATPSMKQFYMRFGDAVFLQIIQEKYDRKNQIGVPWRFGFFLGIDTNFKGVLLATFLIAEDTKEIYVELIKKFIHLMQYNSVETFITPQNQHLEQAIKQVAEEQFVTWHHVYNYVNKVRKMREQLKQTQIYSRRQIRILTADFMNLYHVNSNQQFNNGTRRITRHSRQRQMLEEIVSKKQKLIPYFMGPHFIAFPNAMYLTDKIHKAFQRMLRKTSKKGYIDIFGDFLKLQKALAIHYSRLENPSRKQVPAIFPQVQKIRKHMQLRPYNFIIQNFYKTTPYNCIQKDQNHFEVNGGPQPVILQYEQKKQKWKCQCGGADRYGLPCAHLLKFIRKKGLLLKKYVRQRWYRQDILIVKKTWRSSTYKKHRSNTIILQD